NSAGDLERFALYSEYASDRNVFRETSKATPTWVGCSSRSTLISIEVKPNTALVCCPVLVEKFSTGSAKNARYATEWPSISSSRGRSGLGGGAAAFLAAALRAAARAAWVCVGTWGTLALPSDVALWAGCS